MKKIIFAVVILFGLNVNAEIKLNGDKIDKIENKVQFKKLEKICFEAPEKGKQIVFGNNSIPLYAYDNKIITLLPQTKYSDVLIWFDCHIQDYFANNS
tara:strand:+ start:161 stop:454 length:294 start_codon:yes stop_codon:yes gene_type:complete